MPNAPKPTALKKIQGTERADRKVKNEWQPNEVVTFDAPTELNEWGTALWNDLMEEFRHVKLLTRVDYGSLLVCCNEYGTYMEADDLIKAQGLQVEVEIYDKNGNVVGTKTEKNPMIAVRNESMRNYYSMMKEFGLSPSARTKISAPKATESDPIMDLLKTK